MDDALAQSLSSTVRTAWMGTKAFLRAFVPTRENTTDHEHLPFLPSGYQKPQSHRVIAISSFTHGLHLKVQ